MRYKHLLPVALLTIWLLLNDTLSFGQIVLGIVIALLVTRAVKTLRPLPAWPRRLRAAIGLIAHVLADIFRSNIAVGSIILGASKQQPHIGFLKIPLDMRDPHGLAMLSIIVSSTPGTVWGDYTPEDGVLTLHVLDLQDEETWIRTIKQRYERPLMEIFE